MRFDYEERNFPFHMFKMLSSLQPKDILPVGIETWLITSNHQTYFLYEVLDPSLDLPEPYERLETNG